MEVAESAVKITSRISLDTLYQTCTESISTFIQHKKSVPGLICPSRLSLGAESSSGRFWQTVEYVSMLIHLLLVNLSVSLARFSLVYQYWILSDGSSPENAVQYSRLEDSTVLLPHCYCTVYCNCSAVLRL